MALQGFGQEKTILVPLSIDSSLDMTKEEYDSWLNDPSLERLKTKPGETPVFFRLRVSLPYKAALKLENMKIESVSAGEDGKGGASFKPSFSWMAEDVRMSVIDILNPEGTPEEEKIVFKKAKDGYLDEEIMASLVAMECYMDLWNAKRASKESVNKKK